MRWHIALAFVVACSSGPSSKHDEPTRVTATDDAHKDGAVTTTTTIERVRAAVGNDLGVQVWESIELPGVELFYAANTIEYRGIAVIDGGAPISGADAFKAVRARGVTDPTQLAALSLLFFRKGGDPIVDSTEAASQPPAVRAAIKPPAIHGNVLEFWGWDEQHEQAMRHQLDLTTLQPTSQNGQLATKQR